MMYDDEKMAKCCWDPTDLNLTSAELTGKQPRPQGLLAFQYGGGSEKTLAHSRSCDQNL